MSTSVEVGWKSFQLLLIDQKRTVLSVFLQSSDSDGLRVLSPCPTVVAHSSPRECESFELRHHGVSFYTKSLIQNAAFNDLNLNRTIYDVKEASRVILTDSLFPVPVLLRASRSCSLSSRFGGASKSLMQFLNLAQRLERRPVLPGILAKHPYDNTVYRSANTKSVQDLEEFLELFLGVVRPYLFSPRNLRNWMVDGLPTKLNPVMFYS